MTEVEELPDSKDSTLAVVSLDDEIRSAIHVGDEAKLKQIVESGQRAINGEDDEGCFMLQWAALSEHPTIVRFAS